MVHRGLLRVVGYAVTMTAVGLSLVAAPGAAHATEYQIYVRTPACDTVVVHAESGDTIEAVKHKIQDLTGIPPSQQQLTLSGQVLEDLNTLSDYNIHSGDTIDLSLPGGPSGSGLTVPPTVPFRKPFTVTVNGLAPNAPVKIFLSGRKAWKGRADARGCVTANVKFKKKIKRGTRKVKVTIYKKPWKKNRQTLIGATVYR